MRDDGAVAGAVIGALAGGGKGAAIGTLAGGAAGAGAQVPARFDVQLAQALPFLSFNGAEWQAVVSLRNLVYTDAPDASVFDEISVVRPPKLVAGGVTVRF